MSDRLLLERLVAENQSLTTQVQQLRENERELLNHKQQIDAIFDNAPVEIYLKDKEGRYLKVNRQFEEIFCVKNENLVGKLPASEHDPELAKSTRAQDLAVLSSGEIERREERALLVTDNQIHTLLTVKFPVFDTQGNVNGLGAIVTDISKQKQAEERFLDIVNTIDSIVWEYDAANEKYSYVSPQAERVLGYPVESWKTGNFWIDTMHPEDQLWVPDFCNKCITDGLDSYEAEYRVIASDGRVVWVRILVSVKKESGQLHRLCGLLVDITESKIAKETAKSSESRFQTMFMSAPVGMLLIDLKTTQLLEINPAYTKIVGRSVHEIKKIGWQKITHPDDLAENTHNLKQLQQGKISGFKMLKRFVKPDSSVVWAELTVSGIDNQFDPENLQYLAMLEDVTERKNFEEKIWRQANFDFLTGLPNRSMLHNRLTQLIKKSRRDNKEFALFLIDLDQFKDVNDTLGHDRGDELLIDVSRRIEHCVRESDTVVRFGGDEFVIILSELSYLSGVDRVAQNIIDTLVEPFQLRKDTTYISASIGITLYPKDGLETVTLLKNADQAMYAAKKRGRNCFNFFTPLMQQAAQQRMILVNDLRSAIKNEEFVLHYQPIVELHSGSIVKAEALIRWQQPKRGLVSPIEFIPVAEETGMINEIGDWVFLEAAKQSKQWRVSLNENFQISVNTSPVQFENPANFSWENYLTELEVAGSSIGIEITESFLMTSDQSASNTLLEFRDAGIQVSIDDFGTGYSSLSYLRKFDIDYLKIDQSFVQNLDHDSDDLALCSAIVVMAHKLGIKVIAEGIETQLQKDLLVSIDCDYGQGYLFSKPIPAREFEQLGQL